MYEYLQRQKAKSPYDTIEKVRLSGVNIYVASSGVILIPEGLDRQK